MRVRIRGKRISGEMTSTGKRGMRGGIRRFGGIMAEQEQEYR